MLNNMLGVSDSQNDRTQAQVIESLNSHLSVYKASIAPPAEPRIKLTTNIDLKKFSYKLMIIYLSEAFEVLDNRIDEFQSLIQAHYNLEDSTFNNAANRAISEIVAVERVISDTLEERLNVSSLIIETSRRTGAGLRVPLRAESISYKFFPRQIVAVREINASGEYFSVNEVLEMSLLPPATSVSSTIDTLNERLEIEEDGSTNVTHTLNVFISSGPYTADDNLAFKPLQALCEKASESYADVLIMIGPILDLEHPLLASGDFDLPDDPSIEPDKATLPSFDDFAGAVNPYEFSSFPQPSALVGDSPIRFKNKSSAREIVPDAPGRPKTSANQQAFGNRYDFGASLSAAIQAAGTSASERGEGPSRRDPKSKPGKESETPPVVKVQPSPDLVEADWTWSI